MIADRTDEDDENVGRGSRAAVSESDSPAERKGMQAPNIATDATVGRIAILQNRLIGDNHKGTHKGTDEPNRWFRA
jgi:hypothetical protein